MDTVTVDSKHEQLTNAEWVAQKMGIPEVSIYDYARRGILPCVRIGKLVRFRPSDIENFINTGGKRAA
jgi:predicted DNA-binding transcriptional regulator AlpA